MFSSCESPLRKQFSLFAALLCAWSNRNRDGLDPSMSCSGVGWEPVNAPLCLSAGTTNHTRLSAVKVHFGVRKARCCRFGRVSWPIWQCFLRTEMNHSRVAMGLVAFFNSWFILTRATSRHNSSQFLNEQHKWRRNFVVGRHVKIARILFLAERRRLVRTIQVNVLHSCRGLDDTFLVLCCVG